MNAEFEKELTHLINRHSIENEVDMPDFLLARKEPNLSGHSGCDGGAVAL